MKPIRRGWGGLLVVLTGVASVTCDPVVDLAEPGADSVDDPRRPGAFDPRAAGGAGVAPRAVPGCLGEPDGCPSCGNGACESAENPATCPSDCWRVMVSAGIHSTCAIRWSQTIWCWGRNQDGQLGDGTTSGRATPAVVPGITGVESVSMGGGVPGHACAVRSDGGVACWGANGSGQLGDGALHQPCDPDVYAWDDCSPVPVPVAGLAGATSVAVATDRYGADWGGHSCAVTAGGALLCWGANLVGELGDGTAFTRWTPVPVVGLVDAVSVSTASLRTCAVDHHGAVHCWGYNLLGALGDGTLESRPTPARVLGLTSAVRVSAGGLTQPFACALDADRRVWCWGADGQGQLGVSGTSAPVRCSPEGCIPYRATPVRVDGIEDAVGLSAGAGSHACAVRGDGTVWCWGSNVRGELGDGTTADRSIPGPVPGLAGVTAVSAGLGHTCAVTSDDAIWCWGDNRFGQLGHEGATESLVPVPVPAWTQGMVEPVPPPPAG